MNHNVAWSVTLGYIYNMFSCSCTCHGILYLSIFDLSYKALCQQKKLLLVSLIHSRSISTLNIWSVSTIVVFLQLMLWSTTYLKYAKFYRCQAWFMTHFCRNQGIEIKMNGNKMNGILNSVNRCEKMRIDLALLFTWRAPLGRCIKWKELASFLDFLY